LLGGAVAGLWLPSTGLIRLERKFVLAVAGTCSFCGMPHHATRTLIGTAGVPTRICDECIGLCCDILGEDVGLSTPVDADGCSQSFADEAFQDQVAEILRRFEELPAPRHVDSALADLRRVLDPHVERTYAEFRCSFCDRPRSGVARLISGPRVFICDGCTGDAAAVVTHVLRAA
jgi:ATP-dependent protease Clp ATPase subunit